MVQLYTGLAFEGPHLPDRILQEFALMMDADGATRIDEVKGQIVDPTFAIKHAIGLYQGLSNKVHNSCKRLVWGDCEKYRSVFLLVEDYWHIH